MSQNPSQADFLCTLRLRPHSFWIGKPRNEYGGAGICVFKATDKALRRSVDAKCGRSIVQQYLADPLLKLGMRKTECVKSWFEWISMIYCMWVPLLVEFCSGLIVVLDSRSLVDWKISPRSASIRGLGATNFTSASIWSSPTYLLWRSALETRNT